MIYKNIAHFFMFCGFIAVSSGSCQSAYVDDDGEGGILTSNCLRCICEVVGCSQTGSCSQTSCGPFWITYGYWQSAFHKGLGEEEEYRRCTTKAWCSVRTVHEHMKRFLPKCAKDSDKREVCETAVALHIFGARNCTLPLRDADKNKLYDCMDRLTSEWLTGVPQLAKNDALTTY